MKKYFDFLDRSNHGPYLEEDAWDLDKVTMTTFQMVDKYKLSWDKEQIITNDPGLADTIFDAGLELAKTLGVYNRSTKRIIKFSEKEIEEGLRVMPQEIILGEGKDRRVMCSRKIMDDRPPLFWGGNPGAPIPERFFLDFIMSYAQEPLIDVLSPGSIAEVDGYSVRTGGPMEIVANRREMECIRNGSRRVGRPGMPALAAESAVTALGDVAVTNPKFMRPSDSHLVAMLNELKIDDDNLTRAVNSIEYGVHNASLPCVIVGGLGGDAPGSAVINVASFILSNLICLSDFHILHPIHVRHVATTTRAVLWVENIVAQAFARNAPCIILSDIYPKSGAMTLELLYEVAANTIVNTLSGGHCEGAGAADGAAPNSSGLEARFMAEVGHAIVRQDLTLEEGNGIVLKLLAKYEHIFDLPRGNPGLPFDQVYDLEKLTPTPEWLALYDQAKADLREIGLQAL